MFANPSLYAYFGHHKCASTYSVAMSYEACNALGLKPLERKIAFESSLEEIFPLKKSTFLISQSSTYEKVKELNGHFKGFHIIRDPRDICVSGYFSHIKTHFVEGWPQLAEYRKELKTLSKEDGLLREFEYSDFWLQQIELWNYDDPHIIEVKMEDLTENPYKEWKRIFDFLGLIDAKNYKSSSMVYDLNTKINRGIKYWNYPESLRLNKSGFRMSSLEFLTQEKYSFKKLSGGRKQGQENTDSHYRKGKRGDWRNHFSERHKSVFKHKYGELLIKLGYEKDLNW